MREKLAFSMSCGFLCSSVGAAGLGFVGALRVGCKIEEKGYIGKEPGLLFKSSVEREMECRQPGRGEKVRR